MSCTGIFDTVFFLSSMTWWDDDDAKGGTIFAWLSCYDSRFWMSKVGLDTIPWMKTIFMRAFNETISTFFKLCFEQCASFQNDSFKHLKGTKNVLIIFLSPLCVERIKQFSCHFEVDTLEMKLKCLFLVSSDCRAEQYDFCISEKLGTHINAPSTYLKNNQSVDRIPLHFLVHLPSE